MADLLTQADWDAAHSAWKDATDTFFKETSIYWHRYSRATDQFGESKGNFETINITGYVEADTDTDDNKTEVDGKSMFTKLKVSFHFPKLVDLGYVANGLALFNGDNDYFAVHGKKYNINHIDHQGLTPQGYVIVEVYLVYNNSQL